MALSRKFVLVTINRDRTPEIPKRFNVSAYPSLLTLGPAEENIHRFSGFKKPADFMVPLREALECFELFRKGKDWDVLAPRPASIAPRMKCASFAAPSEGRPQGLAWQSGRLYVAQDGQLAIVDPATGKVERRVPLPKSIVDVCSDGARIYALEYGWTAGKPIHVLDPETGMTLRRIVTEANVGTRGFGASGIAWVRGRLWVQTVYSGASVLDPATGKIERTVKHGLRSVHGIAFDGERVLSVGRQTLRLLSPETGKVERRFELSYPLRSVVAGGGAWYFLEQPVMGFDRKHARVRLWPKRTLVHRVVPAVREVDSDTRKR